MRLALLLGLTMLAGCYSHQRIDHTELDKLAAAPGHPDVVAMTGIGCEGCQVQVDGTTPLVLTTGDGRAHRLTPFYFHLSETQVVSPDYGVLVDRKDLDKAEVRKLSTGGTVALVAGIASAALGTFLAIQFTAGEDKIGE